MKFLKQRENSGFTLVEVAISLLILGLILTPLVVLYNNYKVEEDVRTSYQNVAAVVSSLQEFRAQNGRYPCPSSLTAARNVATYGAENTTACSDGGVSLPDNTCSLVSGLCAETAIPARTAQLAAIPGPVGPIGNRVIVGGVPFRDLQMDESDTVDAYGGRLVYVITEVMTNRDTLNDEHGAIAVRNEVGDSLSQNDGGIAFAVISHGPTKMGAYNSAGQLFAACTAGLNESQNCNAGFATGGAIAANSSIYISAPISTGAGGAFYDDQMIFFSQSTDPYWQRIDGNMDDIEDLSPDTVNVGLDASIDTAMEVVSPGMVNAMRVYGTNANDGKIKTNLLCDENGENCFTPSDIGGTDMAACPANEYAVGIEGDPARPGHSRLICTRDMTGVLCEEPTPIFTGVDSAGNPICVSSPGNSCPSEPRVICPNSTAKTVTLPATSDTGITEFFDNTSEGGCRKERYRCNDGTWDVLTSSGVCALAGPSTATVSCGPGYGGGTYTRTTTPTCSGNTVTNDFATACVCVGETLEQTRTCRQLRGGSWTSAVSLTRTITYDATTCTPDNPAWDYSTCTCREDQTWDRWCNQINSRYKKAPMLTYTRTYDLSNNCSTVNSGWDTSQCSCRDPELKNFSCAYKKGAGWIGTAVRTRTYSGESCDVSDTWDTSDCSCDTTPQVSYDNPTCANPTCEEVDTQNKYETQIDPATCALMPSTKTLVTAGTCKAKTFKWKKVAPGIGYAHSTPSSPRYIGDPCGCEDRMETGLKICYEKSDPNWKKFKCSCQ